MSQTSLVESSSNELPRHGFENAPTLRLDPPDVSEEARDIKQSFTLMGRYIYETTATPATPTYHISTRNTQTGTPWQLQLCRLLPSEARRLSVASSTAAEEPFIKYDDDLTLYSGEKIHIPISLGQKPLIVIRGQKRGTIQGSVLMEKTRRSYKFYRMTPIRRALTPAEEERMQARMHKRGYRDSDDWNKTLVLTVQESPGKASGELTWLNEQKAAIAVEKDGALNFIGGEETETKDLVVACWACKDFVLAKSD